MSNPETRQRPDGQPRAVSIPIPRGLTGQFIGKNGQNIHFIRHTTGVLINVVGERNEAQFARLRPDPNKSEQEQRDSMKKAEEVVRKFLLRCATPPSKRSSAEEEYKGTASQTDLPPVRKPAHVAKTASKPSPARDDMLRTKETRIHVEEIHEQIHAALKGHKLGALRDRY